MLPFELMIEFPGLPGYRPGTSDAYMAKQCERFESEVGKRMPTGRIPEGTMSLKRIHELDKLVRVIGAKVAWEARGSRSRAESVLENA